MSSSQTDQVEDPLVRTAVSFLKNPKVINASINQKISFLKRKGLSDEQIYSALSYVGEKVTLDEIKAVPAAVSQSSAGVGAATLSDSTYTVYPPHTPPTQNGSSHSDATWDWRNIVIGAGAAAAASYGLVKAWSAFSPYELKRRSEAPQALSDVCTGDSNLMPSVPFPPLPALPENTSSVTAASGTTVESLQKEIADLNAALTAERKNIADITVRTSMFRAEKVALANKNDRLQEQISDLESQIEELKKYKLENEMKQGEEQANNEDQSNGTNDPPEQNADEEEKKDNEITDYSNNFPPPSETVEAPAPPVDIAIGEEIHTTQV